MEHIALVTGWSMAGCQSYQWGAQFPDLVGAVRARAILVPCTTDLYFPPEDNAIEAEHMPHAELRPYASPWGHCAATPSREGSGFMRFLDACMAELLEGRALR